MFKYKKHIFFTLLITASMFITACDGQTAQDPFIQTAIAQTVTAKNAEQNAAANTEPPVEPVFTQTPLQFSPTLTALPVTASPAGGNASSSPCAKASLVSETIIDGTIYKPGEQFTKTWEIKNTSTCTWDSSYRIIFWNGNILGGAYYYSLPQSVPPEGIIPISLVLTTPAEDGTYKSEWALQTPDKVNFGVGEYSAPFYAQVVVSSSAKPNYAITSVTYEMVRVPATGCPANVTYTAYATVSVNGPLEFKYRWAQSDGHTVNNPDIIKMDAAGSIVLSNPWQLNLATDPGTRWMALEIGFTDGETYHYTTYPQVEFTKLCGS